MRTVCVLGATALVVVSFVACDEKLSDLLGPVTPNLQPTLTSIQNEIFNTTDASGRVACTQCHSNQGRAPSAGMNLLPGFAYANLVNVPSSGKPGAIRVIPGDPENSYIIHKIEGRSTIVGQRMPRTGGPYLSPNQIRVIRRWIELGAPNN